MRYDSRLLLALATTPLLVPGAIGVTQGTAALPYGLIAGYGCMIAFGLPVYFFIRARDARGWTTPGITWLGAALGLASWCVTGALRALLSGQGFAGARTAVTDLGNGAFLAGAVGVVIALLIWRLAGSGPVRSSLRP